MAEGWCNERVELPESIRLPNKTLTGYRDIAANRALLDALESMDPAYVTMAGSASGTLGLLAYGWAPVMVVMGFAIMIASLQRSGGPFFFDQNEFLFSNTLLLVLFGAMVFTALRRRRHTGWHRRLMLVAMSILTGPGLGRLLPMPLLMPNAWRIMMVVTLIFPVVGMIVDKRRQGHVHPAYFWGVGAIIAVQVIADLIAYSAWGVSVTQSIVGGTPGGERPMAAFLPPGI